MYNGKIVVAEVKTYSPITGYEAKESWQELLELAANVGDIVSLLVEKEWRGSKDLIGIAKTQMKQGRIPYKPILAKGIHRTDSDFMESINAGADYVLVAGRVPGMYSGRVWIEPNNLDELKQIKQNSYTIVHNSRDLTKSFEQGKEVMRAEKFEDFRRVWPWRLCQASNIITKEDVHPDADLIIVGQHLREFAESIKQNV